MARKAMQVVSESEASSSSNSEEDTETKVESLVSGRSKRITAGNRLSTLLNQDSNDDLELLFAEVGEVDAEFEEDDTEAASDVQLDSSSSDEAPGRANDDDDLEGERELQKQDRIEKQRKRKAHEVFKRPGGLRQKLRVDPTTTGTLPVTPASRPKKKTERVSWISTPDGGPTRSSTRKQTVQNKEVINLRMLANEKRRVKLIQVMDAAAERKKAMKSHTMTQAERMEEAARTERRNAKSLNRWEEMEKKKAEEQRAKLEALQNRQLSGPVITWWSGPAQWINGKLGPVGAKALKEALRDPRSDPDVQANAADERPPRDQPSNQKESGSVVISAHDSPPELPETHASTPPAQDAEPLPPTQPINLRQPDLFPEGTHPYASSPVEPQSSSIPSAAPALDRSPSVATPFPASDVRSRSRPPEPISRPFTPGPPSVPTVEYSGRSVVILRNITAPPPVGSGRWCMPGHVS